MCRPTLRLLPALLLVFGSAARADSSADELLGRYWLPEHDGQIEIYRTGDRFHGRVVSYEVPEQLDEQNPDPELRTRRFVGIHMLKDFDFDPSDARWVGGTIYDARSGNTYDARLWFEGRDRSVLWARGFIGTPFFGRTERFERLSPSEAANVAAGPPAGASTNHQDQAEYLGAIFLGISLGILAQAPSIAVAMLGASALVASAAVLVVRSRAGREPSPELRDG